MRLLGFTRLKKDLSLLDVYVVSTGAMISSGLFLLPGIAIAHTGPSVVLAYLISGLLIVPAVVSQAELATAMPRAGGAYYYLDRTLGPLVGTIGGVGTWLALVLKSAFALIGMGAYVALVFEFPIIPTAIGFTVVFAALNIIGAKESTRFLRAFVVVVLSVLTLFMIHGLYSTTWGGALAVTRSRFVPFLTDGVDGLLGTIGLVFVSYVGLTKVASLAEEVKNPDRNIPLGMVLALITVTGIYVVAVYIMVATLGMEGLSGSLTPVATTAEAFATWIPKRAAVWFMVGAAVFAFAGMANAGILSASRYPLAMGRDRLFPDLFAGTGRWNTPVPSILLTCGLLILFLVALNVEEVAKLASALQLLLFGLLNIAVIVMRESRIESYDPGFRAPLYPWMQLAGIFVPLVLVAEMGWLPVLFTLGVTGASVGWYTYYAQQRIARDGAIYHVFERLGRRRFAGLDRELRDIMKEKGARAEDPFDYVVAHADVIDRPQTCDLIHVVSEASNILALKLSVPAGALREAFGAGIHGGGTPVSHGAALLHTRLPELDESEMVIVRCRDGVQVDVLEGNEEIARQAAQEPIRAVFFLVSGESDPGRHLRILAQIAGRVDDEAFMPEWLSDRDDQELKETLLRDDRFFSLTVRSDSKTASLMGRTLRDLHMPEGSLVALIRREGRPIVPRGQTVLRDGDRLTVIGEPVGLAELARRYVDV